ncbi:MAG TPA: hypothetical protein V6C85_15390, partial [Allocoleopsis sp.]
MSKFIPTRRGNPCPVCDKTNGHCKQNQDDPDYWLCAGRLDAGLYEVLNGYKCLGDTSDRGWKQFKLVSSIDAERSPHTRLSLKPGKPKAKAHSTHSVLSVEARDKAIRLLCQHFGLLTKHSQSLRDRGLSDSQIKSRLYFSIIPDRPVPHGIPANLPGIYDGKLQSAGIGYACVTFDPLGKATGWQIRLDNASKNKYRWAKGKASCHLVNGELPITSVYPVEAVRHSSIGVCEGVNKSWLAANRLRQVFIGASSANFAASPEQTAEHLAAAAFKLGSQTIDFYPDGGAVSNPNVIKCYQRSWQLFTQLGYQVRVVWWNQVDKNSPDCDEIDSLEQVQYLSICEFEAICSEHGGLG